MGTIEPLGVIVVLGVIGLAIAIKLLWPPNKDEQVIPRTVVAPAVKVFNYPCQCGQSFTTAKEINSHLLKLGRKEKGQHKSLGKTETKGQVVIPNNEVTLGGKCDALILSRSTRGGSFDLNPGKISKPLGNLFYCDPSMPSSGWRYFVKQKDDGSLEAYDPRRIPLISKQTPSMAYFATHWEIVNEVFAFNYSLLHDGRFWMAIILGIGAILAPMVLMG